MVRGTLSCSADAPVRLLLLLLYTSLTGHAATPSATAKLNTAVTSGDLNDDDEEEESIPVACKLTRRT